MNNLDRQMHVDDLGEQLGCEVVQRPGMSGMMFVEFEPPKIEGPTIESQIDYYTMLHEFGHVVMDHTQGRPPFEDKTRYFDNGVLRSEAEAWLFALVASEDAFVEDETRQFMLHTCIGSYYSGAVAARGMPGQRLRNGNRHYVSFTYDEADAFFWGVVQLLVGDHYRTGDELRLLLRLGVELPIT